MLNIILTRCFKLQLHHEKFHEVRSRGQGHHNYKASRFLVDFVLIKAEGIKDASSLQILPTDDIGAKRHR